ncbi:MAG: urease accessory protein UreD [Pseudomonadota bacterium]
MIHPRDLTPPRAEGEAVVTVRRRDGRDRLARLRQQGSAKCLLPRRPGAPEAVLLNTAGGITGGDRLRYTAGAEAGAALSVATQAAERLYRAPAEGPPGRMHVRLTVGPGATLLWAPQETIAFDGARFHRRLEAEAAPDARLLILESLVLGRTAMGERVARAEIRDDWRVRRGGALVFADALRLSGETEAATGGPATFGGRIAAASLLYMAPDAEARLADARAVLPETGGASHWNGCLAIRILAEDGQALRRHLMALLGAIAPLPIPHVWTL